MTEQSASLDVRIAPLFATPLAELRYPQPHRLCPQLAELFLERERSGDEYRNKTRRGTQHGDLFESRFDLFTWPEPEVQELGRFCHTGVVTMLRSIADVDEARLAQLKFNYHAWFHVTRNGGYQGVHNHQNAAWSGIFCVDPGDEVADRPDSGRVRFHDPKGFADMYRDAGNRTLRPPFNLDAFDVTHEAGKLLVFPSYLFHEIFVYVGTRPRIVVAFNCAVAE